MTRYLRVTFDRGINRQRTFDFPITSYKSDISRYQQQGAGGVVGSHIVHRDVTTGQIVSPIAGRVAEQQAEREWKAEALPTTTDVYGRGISTAFPSKPTPTYLSKFETAYGGVPIPKPKTMTVQDWKIATGQISTLTPAPERTKVQRLRTKLLEGARVDTGETGVKGQVYGAGALLLGGVTGAYQTTVYPVLHPVKTARGLWETGKEAYKTKGGSLLILGGEVGKKITTQPSYATGWGIGAIAGAKGISKGFGKIATYRPTIAKVYPKTVVRRIGVKGFFKTEAPFRVTRKGFFKDVTKTGKIEVWGGFKPFKYKPTKMPPVRTRLFYDIFATKGKKFVSRFEYKTYFGKKITTGKGYEITTKLPKRYYKGVGVTTPIGSTKSFITQILGRTGKRIKVPARITPSGRYVPKSIIYTTKAITKQVGKKRFAGVKGDVIEFLISKQPKPPGEWIKLGKLKTITKTITKPKVTPPPVAIKTIETIAKRTAFPITKPSAISNFLTGGIIMASALETPTQPIETIETQLIGTPIEKKKVKKKIAPARIITPKIITPTRIIPKPKTMTELLIPTTTITPPTYPTKIVTTPYTKLTKARLTSLQKQMQKQRKMNEMLMGSKMLQLQQQAKISKQVYAPLLIHQPISKSMQKQAQKLKGLFGLQYPAPTPTPRYPTPTPAPFLIPFDFQRPRYERPRVRRVKKRKLKVPKRAYQPSVGAAILGYDIGEKAFKKASKKRLIAGGLGLRPVVRKKRKVKKAKRKPKKRKTKRRK